VKENYVYIAENKGTGDAVQGNGHSHKHMLLLCKQMVNSFYQQQWREYQGNC
jgi:hypothetical protein